MVLEIDGRVRKLTGGGVEQKVMDRMRIDYASQPMNPDTKPIFGQPPWLEGPLHHVGNGIIDRLFPDGL